MKVLDGLFVIASLAGGALGGFLFLVVVAGISLSNEKASQPKCVEGYVFVRDHQLIDDQGHGVRCAAEKEGK